MRKIFFSTLFINLLWCVPLCAQQSDSILHRGLGEVEVSATAIPSTSQSGTPLQVYTEKDILKQGIQSVADAVKRFNGVVVKDYGGIGGLKTVSIRGMGAEYTAISYDGVVVNNLQSGQVDIGRFSLDNISMLSLSIGQADDIFLPAKSFSTAGVLNLQTRRPQFGDSRSKIHTKITTGSFGHFEPMIDYAYKASEKTAITANINWQRADGRYPFTQKEDKLFPDRKRRNSDTDIFRTEVNLYNKLSKTDLLDVKFYYFNSERGLPGYVILYNDNANARLWDKNAFMQVAYNKIFNPSWKFKSQAKYDYTYTKHKESIAIGDSFSRYRLHEVYWTNSVLYTIMPSLSVSFSQDLAYNSLRSGFDRFNDSRSEPDRYSSLTALAAQYKIENLTLTASGLMTHVNEKVKGKDNDKTYDKLSPSFSASYKPFSITNLRVRASYKHVYRIPTFSELYYIATGRSLAPESSSQYNVGLTWIGNIKNTPIEYVNISLDAYYNDVKDKIVIIPTPFLPSVMNKGKVKMKGIDARIQTNVKVYEELSFDLTGSYSYMQAYDDDRGNTNSYKGQLPYTPKHSGSVTLTFKNPWVNLSYSALASGIRYTNAENITDNKIESYSDHSVSLFKEMQISKYTLYANGSVLNLLDKNYNIIAYYPMPGRSFKLSVGCKF